jgi:hypothetical protein
MKTGYEFLKIAHFLSVGFNGITILDAREQRSCTTVICLKHDIISSYNFKFSGFEACLWLAYNVKDI